MPRVVSAKVGKSDVVAVRAAAKLGDGVSWWWLLAWIYSLGVIFAVLPVVVGRMFLMRVERESRRIAQGSWVELVTNVREVLGI